MCAETSSGAHPTQTDYGNERKVGGGCFTMPIETTTGDVTLLAISLYLISLISDSLFYNLDCI